MRRAPNGETDRTETGRDAMDDENAQNEGRQAHMRFDDSPERFRNANPGQHFSGSSGVLFEQAMAQSRMAITLADPKDPDMPIVFVNRAFMRLTGYPEDEVIGRNCRFLQGPGTDPETVSRVRSALASEEVIVVEMLNYRRDGSSFWNALHLGPIYGERGELIYYFGSQWDVSDVHTARADEKHARMLARELSHRMKNMFAVISGLVTITGRTRGIQDETSEINDRIRALGRAFETTLDEASRGSVDLRPAIEAVLDPYDASGDSIHLAGPNVRVDPVLVSTIGLALHELATNALKYGALGREGGRVHLRWQTGEGDRDGEELLFHWTETGGPRPQAPAETSGGGSGLGIVDTLLTTTGGALEPDWREEGLAVRILIPNATRS